MNKPNVYLSPAKINWFLHITGRRDDGYHTLETVFQRINWYDELEITARNDGQICLSGDLSGVATERNLAYRAALALKNHASQPELGANIHLNKNIPTGAGLGGGSSNAATVLTVLNDLWALQLPRVEIQELGLSLGADVPFFVRGLNAAFASGIGECLHPIKLPKARILLVNPNVHVATTAVFSHKQLQRNHPPLRLDDEQLVQMLISKTKQSSLMNDLEYVTFSINSEVQAVYHALCQTAPDMLVRMSGSGASVFAVPNSAAHVRALQAWRARQPINWYSRWVHAL